MWRVRKPETVAGLAEAADRCQTLATRRLVQGYAALLDEGGGALPRKNGLDLRRFAGALPDLMLAAVSKPDRWICRLAGERIQKRLGRNPTGGNYYDIVPKERRANAMHAMNMVIDVPCGFRAELMQTHADGLVRFSETMALPLASDEAGVDGFILFADAHIRDHAYVDDGKPNIVGANVIQRDVIDLGHGIDDTFEDIVPS